jgi:hypothetical protein
MPAISTSPRPWRRSPTRSRSDETSSKAEWHIPRAHYLESWGDARAVGGTLSVVQPLILPLFGGRSPLEVLGLMVAGQDCPGYDIVRRPGSRSWARPSSTECGTACCTTGCFPAASFPKSFPLSQGSRLRSSAAFAPQALRRARQAFRGGCRRGGKRVGRSPGISIDWRSSSSPPPRFTTAASRTTDGCRSFPIPSPS